VINDVGKYCLLTDFWDKRRYKKSKIGIEMIKTDFRPMHAIKDLVDFQRANPNCSVLRLKRKIASIIQKHGITKETFDSAVQERIGQLEARLARLEDGDSGPEYVN